MMRKIVIGLEIVDVKRSDFHLSLKLKLNRTKKKVNFLL